jgi:arsenate reductase
MLEVGVDITAGHPKLLTVDAARDSDVVIATGCGDTCPVFPASAGRPIECVRHICDEIRAGIQALLRELLPVAAREAQ